MENELNQQIAALRQAKELGCFGAHRLPSGEWMPCSSSKQLLVVNNEIKSRMSLEDVQRWSSARKAKGKKRKKRWEKLRERRVLGIDTLQGGGLVSGNSRTSANVVSGGSIPPMTYGNTTPPNMSTKSIQPAYMPRDNDPDVFVDIESARKRAQQLGCIGVSRRMSKGGKTVWMPCTNLSDYNNLTGMTALGRINQAKRNDRVVRTIIKDELKKRKKSISEEILGKSLGPKIRGVGRAIASRFDPKAVDGDEDGLLQDGTPFERPNVPKPKLTPPSGSVTNQGSPKRTGGKPVSAPIKLDDLKNPEASPTNPFRNLGGKMMGKIIRGMVDPKNKGKQDRRTYIVGGNTGSGKSTVYESHLVGAGLVPSSQEAAVIDPDFIKQGLVGYNDGDGAGDVHAESQVATDRLINDVASEGMDMVVMGSGASRQIKHMREAMTRGESVVGHWVHVPQSVASQRIKTRRQQSGRYIPDNTAHMARSIPRAISTAFEEDLLDEFYLWDNDVPQGKPPKLIASKVRGKKFEVFDKPKFEEFAGDKKWADTWVETADNRESRGGGLASKVGAYTGAEAIKSLAQIGFEIKWDEKIFISLPEGIPAFDYYEKRVKPMMVDKSGRHSLHRSRLKMDGEVIPNFVLKATGINVDRKRLTEKEYIEELRLLLVSSDPEILAELFSRAPIQGPNGEARFGELNVADRFKVTVDKKPKIKTPAEYTAEKTGLSGEQISILQDNGFTLKEIEEMPKDEALEYIAISKADRQKNPDTPTD